MNAIPSELSAAAQKERRTKPGEEALRHRVLSAVERLLDLVGTSAVSDALSAQTGFDSLNRLLDSLLKEHPEVVLVDHELASHLRLVKARRDLLARAGGTYDTGEAADLLGITAEAVRKRVYRGSLLSYLSPSGEHRLPRIQFSESGVIEGLEEVLDAMHVQEPWMRIQLLLDRDVVGALEEGRIDDAVRAADSYLPRDEIEE